MNSRPEPIVKRAAVAAVVTAIVGALGMFGVHISDGMQSWIIDGICAAAPLAAFLWSALAARRHVTPVAAPVDAAGGPLVPATSDYADEPAEPAEEQPPNDDLDELPTPT